ncbi:hypothetical protein RSOLAG1IB_11631 [Rhizoctonia solani AG-1 IB]|uniref:Uncharacterized protein n=1 Tax=Thanatephorus cucumeris (strain AG1-IB / isolate 7/3/14) TaxID=1108050 RepID=A0A0B7FDG7_THACB|nr:hypothetical protein RSOLAG1IB_11631 [Rhizoctonia solani AG-1 IB]
MDINFYVQNSLEAMKDKLGSAANISHVLLYASSRHNIWCVRRNTYKHPRWGFMYWLDPKAKEGPQSLCNICVYHWWHFLASTPLAFQDFVQWHCQGFLTLPPVVSAPLSAQELHAAVHNFVLLYPADMPPVPASSPPFSNTLSNSEESLATPSAETFALLAFQSANIPTPPQGLWQSPPSPPVDIWQPFSFKGWNQDKIQRHGEAFNPDYRQGEEEMLFRLSDWL